MDKFNQYLGGLLNLPVRRNMKENPPIVSPLEPISTAMRLMMHEDTGAVVVVVDDRPVGILTERDLLQRVINAKRDFESTPVCDVMSHPPVTIEEEQSVQDALRNMREHDIRRLIVTKNGLVTGLTTERRLLEVAYSDFASEAYGSLKGPLYDESSKIGATYVSTYPPRECGIATFTEDLVGAISRTHVLRPPLVVAVNDQGGYYDYSIDVRLQIDEDDTESYAKAAWKINESTVKVVNLQHEYGIFGGEWGEHVIPFLEIVKKPIVTTLHTVLEEPGAKAKDILQRIVELSNTVIVLAKAGIRILEETYGGLAKKISYIPHGCPNIPYVETELLKPNLGLEGRIVLSTFGLLSRGKGVEYAIEALQEIVRKEPRVLYLVIGETHPEVRKREGEEYREKLLNLVQSLGLRRNVRFVNRFLAKNELMRYLQATDIYIAPYPNREQISSGTLVTALSAGKAIVTTPFHQAKEVILEGAAMRSEFMNPRSISNCVMALLNSEKMKQSFQKRAYDYSRNMIWPNVAMQYVNTFYRIAQ